MITPQNLRILMQHINALEEAVEKLEECYNSRNMVGVNKLKKFILDVYKRTGILLGGAA